MWPCNNIYYDAAEEAAVHLRITQAAGGGAEAVTVIPTVIHSPSPLPDERICTSAMRADPQRDSARARLKLAMPPPHHRKVACESDQQSGSEPLCA